MSGAISTHALSNLIGSIYDCALDPERWSETLSTIADAFECAVASLTLSDTRENTFLINKASGWDPALLALKTRKHVPEINARLTEWLATQASIDEPFVTSRHLTPEYVSSSEYVRECLVPQGIADIMHVFLMYTPAHFSEIGLGRHETNGAITQREVELGQLLLPHLRRAVTISNVLDHTKIERATMAEALDSLVCAVILTGENGVILHANRQAERILREGTLLRDMRGALAASLPVADRELRTALKLARHEGARIGATGLAIRLSGPDVSPVLAHVLPLRVGDVRTRLEVEAMAAVFIGPSANHGAAAVVAECFGLTTSESRLLEHLLEGRPLSQTAVQLGIASSTAKTHLDHIFAKVGVSRQTELIRQAAQLVPPVGAPGS